LSLAESLVYRQTVESDRILASSGKVGRRLFTITVKWDASCTRASQLFVVAEKDFSPKSQILTKKRMTARLSVASAQSEKLGRTASFPKRACRPSRHLAPSIRGDSKIQNCIHTTN
jgi:hypothetical protein